jgi:hypothetical protein
MLRWAARQWAGGASFVSPWTRWLYSRSTQSRAAQGHQTPECEEQPEGRRRPTATAGGASAGRPLPVGITIGDAPVVATLLGGVSARAILIDPVLWYVLGTGMDSRVGIVAVGRLPKAVTVNVVIGSRGITVIVHAIVRRLRGGRGHVGARVVTIVSKLGGGQPLTAVPDPA